MENEENQSEWTEDEKRLLRNERFVAEIDRIRNPSVSSPKPTWQRLLESTGGSALITVLIGGIFGTIITAMFQSASKDRDFEQAWIKMRGDQAMIGYKDFLDKQRETAEKVFERVGKLVSASEDLISLSRPDLTPRNDLSPIELKGILEERKRIKEKYRDAGTVWVNERDVMGMLVGYYFPRKLDAGQSGADSSEGSVRHAWQAVKDAVARYTSCAEEWSNNPFPRDPRDACSEQKMSVVDSLHTLNKSLEFNQRYTWEGWESADNLRNILYRKR